MNHLHLVLDCINKFIQNNGKEPKKIIISKDFADKLEVSYPVKGRAKLYGYDFKIDNLQTHSLRFE